MERYDELVPADFELGEEKGIILAAQITKAIEGGVLHFKCNTYEYLPSAKDILLEINKNKSIISWHKEMGDNVGLHEFVNFKNILIPAPPELLAILKGGKNEN